MSYLDLQSPSNLFYRIRNCISHGAHTEALLIYTHTRHSGISLFGVVTPLLLKACSSLAMLDHGKALHAESIKSGVESDVMVGTSLLDMYAKCGYVSGARNVFDSMPKRNIVTWNAMIGGYTRNYDMNSALILFEQMSVRSTITWNEMINGYAKSGDTVTARRLFDEVPVGLRNVVTWTMLVDGYARKGEMEAAKEIFEEMPIRNHFVWSSMISGYCKKGDVEAAKAIFERIPELNLVNWNSLISGLAQNGSSEEALDVFHRMQTNGFEADEVTLSSVLSACSQLGLLDVGKMMHKMIIQKGIKVNQFTLNGLVDMYAKCGDLGNAILIFERIPKKNDACWNSMISGLAIHGQCKGALELFSKMVALNEKPNDVTFSVVLSACAHGGLVEEGLETFSKMEKYGIIASIKHYGCLIDLLGKAGRLKEAYDLVQRMRVKPNDTVWGTLLGACRIHSDMDMANRILDEVARVSVFGSNNDSHYVLLSNIYAGSDSWGKAEKMRAIMSYRGLQKTPGHSSFMLN